MKKTLIAALALGLGMTISLGAAAAEKTLSERHAGMWPKSVNGYVTKNQCKQCHMGIAQKTASLEPNPHENHLGDVNCEDCHKANAAKPQLMCNECHQFKITKKAAQK
ncbi:MAG: cytochrome c3 family protein [Duodenibacillus sp.]|nr:cytochrome c3 family protein [Duodenibacillus sp.]